MDAYTFCSDFIQMMLLKCYIATVPDEVAKRAAVSHAGFNEKITSIISDFLNGIPSDAAHLHQKFRILPDMDLKWKDFTIWPQGINLQMYFVATDDGLLISSASNEGELQKAKKQIRWDGNVTINDEYTGQAVKVSFGYNTADPDQVLNSDYEDANASHLYVVDMELHEESTWTISVNLWISVLEHEDDENDEY